MQLVVKQYRYLEILLQIVTVCDGFTLSEWWVFITLDYLLTVQTKLKMNWAKSKLGFVEKKPADLYILSQNSMILAEIKERMKTLMPRLTVYPYHIEKADEEKLDFMLDNAKVMIVVSRGHNAMILSNKKPSLIGKLYERAHSKRKASVMIVAVVTYDQERLKETERRHSSINDSIDCWEQLQREGTEVISTSLRPPEGDPDGDFLTAAQKELIEKWMPTARNLGTAVDRVSASSGQGVDTTHQLSTSGRSAAFPYVNKDKFTIISSDKEYLKAVTEAVKEATRETFPSLPLHQFQMTSSFLTDEIKDCVKSSQFILLVAVWNQRLIIISDKEDSQLGKVYYFAVKDCKRKPLLILAGDANSEKLQDDELYHESLKTFVQNQSAITELDRYERFLSLGRYIDTPLHFNSKQQEVLTQWISG